MANLYKHKRARMCVRTARVRGTNRILDDVLVPHSMIMVSQCYNCTDEVTTAKLTLGTQHAMRKQRVNMGDTLMSHLFARFHTCHTCSMLEYVGAVPNAEATILRDSKT